MNVLVIGASGLIGRRLMARLGPSISKGTFKDRPLHDGVRFDAEAQRLHESIPNLSDFSHAVILFGITNPDACFREQDRSAAINIDATKVIINDLRTAGVIPVFASSESVFDGVKRGYTESDEASPIMVYGHQKRVIELFLRETCPISLIIRFGRVFGSDRSDGTLLTGWMENICKNEVIRCAADQVFSPLHVDEAAEGLTRLIAQDRTGLYHLCGPRPYRRIEMLRLLAAFCQRRIDFKGKIVEARMKDFPALEERPLNTSMCPDKIMRETGMTINDLSLWCERIAGSWFGV